MKLSVLSAAILLSSFTATTFANESDSGFFLGADLAITQHKVSASGYEDESDMGSSLGFNVGYQINENWAVKLSTVDLGKVEPFDGFETDGKGKSLTGVWSSPRILNDWSFYLEFGLMQWDTSLIIDTDFGKAGLDDSGTDIIGGLGASYAINENLDVTVFGMWMATETNIPLDAQVDFEVQYSRYGVGLQYRF